MNDERQCRLCKYFKVKNKLFGGKKLICSKHNCESGGSSVCSEFVRNADKVLQSVKFRSHVFGSPDVCNSCIHCIGVQGKTGRIYSCEKNNVQFWPDFSTTDYICDNFVDGGLDLLISRFAETVVEQERYKQE